MKRWDERKKELEMFELKEMANITSKWSGLSKGTIQIKPEKRHSLHPHIHFVYDVKKSEVQFIKFTIDSDIEKIKVLEEKNIKVSKKDIEDIKFFISKNAKLLTKYYLQAELMDTGDFFLHIKKIDNA